MSVRGCAIAFGIAASTVSAAAGQAAERAVVVRCVDPGGRSVAGAIVYLFQLTGPMDAGGRYVAGGERTSDRDGRAVFEGGLSYDGGAFDRVVIARVPGQFLGTARAVRAPAAGLATTAIEVALVPSRTWTGTVAVPPGFRAGDVRVSVHASYEGPRGVARLRGDPGQRGLSDALPEWFECRVAADGRFAIADLPADAFLYLIADAPGLASCHWSNVRQPDLPLALVLSTERVLAGRVLFPDGGPCASAKVTVWYGADGKLTWQRVDREVRSDASGSFRVGGLPDLDAHVEVAAPGIVFVPQRVRPHLPAAANELVLRAVPGHVVTGTVLTASGMVPEQDVWLESRLEGSDVRHGITRIDRHGRFTMLLPVGKSTVRLLPRSSFACTHRDIVVQLSHSGVVEPPLDFLVTPSR